MADSATAAAAAATPAAPQPEQPTPPDQREDWEIQRDEHKQSADRAFRAGGFKTAIDQYTKAISVDPESVVLHSNRSAAYLANGETSRALRDARTCVALDASFVKGHSRLAAALLALKRFEQAGEAYERVLEKDPGNASARRGAGVCQREIAKRLTLEERKRRKQEEEREKAEAAAAAAAKEAEKVDEKGNDDDEDEDDLLNDFFDEVDEVVAKKEASSSSSNNNNKNNNNAIRNDRETLGTARQQIDRLLKPRYEWRNLNPYYVLQLPAATATDEDISRRYKALSLLLHPDKNRSALANNDDEAEAEKERERAQLAYDQVQTAKNLLSDPGRKKYAQSLVAEGMKNGEARWKREQHRRRKTGNNNNKQNNNSNNNKEDGDETLESVREKEVMRIFAQIEMKRKEVEERERRFEQREQQQEDDELEKQRRERKFDKQWRKEDRVDKRVGNWREFDATKKKKKKKRTT